MATFTPFMQGSKAQGIINDYLGGDLNSTPNVNSAGKFRNPFYDLRTVQEGLGELDPSADFPNPQLDFSVPDTPVDPCPEGFMLVDGICQPVEQFGQSVYQEDNGKSFEEERAEERDYFSIDAMKDLSDEKLIEYLKDGRLSNSGALGFLPSKGDVVTLKDSMLTSPLFKLAFGKQEEMRRQFMIDELTKRGFNIGTNDDGQQQFNINPTLYNENLDQAVKQMNYRQDNEDDIVPTIKSDGTFGGFESVDRTSGDFYQQTRPSENLGSLLNNDGSRNQENYNKALRENVRNTVLAPEQTISYTDPKGKTYTANAPRSNYSSTLGGFTGGR